MKSSILSLQSRANKALEALKNDGLDAYHEKEVEYIRLKNEILNTYGGYPDIVQQVKDIDDAHLKNTRPYLS